MGLHGPQSLLLDPLLLLVGWGGGHQSHCPIPSAPRFSRLRRFDLRAAPSPRRSLVPPVDLELATGLGRRLRLPCFEVKFHNFTMMRGGSLYYSRPTHIWNQSVI